MLQLMWLHTLLLLLLLLLFLRRLGHLVEYP
jgi:hypothetical protein